MHKQNNTSCWFVLLSSCFTPCASPHAIHDIPAAGGLPLEDAICKGKLTFLSDIQDEKSLKFPAEMQGFISPGATGGALRKPPLSKKSLKMKRLCTCE